MQVLLVVLIGKNQGKGTVNIPSDWKTKGTNVRNDLEYQMGKQEFKNI
jgi:hypothetical protein